MKDISLIKHASGAPGLRLFGIGPAFKPIKGLEKLQVLFNQNTLSTPMVLENISTMCLYFVFYHQ